MEINTYLIIAGVGGLILGIILSQLLFSKKKLIKKLTSDIKQEKLKSDAKVGKAFGDLKTINSDYEVCSNFIAATPQLLMKIRSQDSIDGISNIVSVFLEKFFQAKQIAFFFFDPAKSVLVLRNKKGLPQQIPLGYSIRIGDGKIGWAAQKRMVMNSEDFETETFMVKQQIEKNTTVYFKVDLCAPITYQDKLLGLISLGNQIRRTKADKVMIQSVLDIIAPYIQNIIDNRNMKNTQTHEEPEEKKEFYVDKPNFFNRLDQRIEESKMMGGSTLTLAVIEIDKFSLFIQRYGLNPGERAIKAISQIMLNFLPNAEVKGRLEESLFAAYFLNKPYNQIYNNLNNFRETISQYNFNVDLPNEFGKLTISAGLSTFPNNADNMETLHGNALQQIRAARSAGGNYVLPTIENASTDDDDDSFDVEILNALEE